MASTTPSLVTTQAPTQAHKPHLLSLRQASLLEDSGVGDAAYLSPARVEGAYGRGNDSGWDAIVVHNGAIAACGIASCIWPVHGRCRSFVARMPYCGDGDSGMHGRQG
ncbi:hypothetical protein O988_09611, partial [Pseudogymnoascus sp. VKM F-3808]